MTARTRVVCWVVAIVAAMLIVGFGPPLDPLWRWRHGRCWVWRTRCAP